MTSTQQPFNAAVTGLPNGARSLKEAVRVFERNLIMDELQRNSYDKRRVAKLLGISISSLYRKIAELSIDDREAELMSADGPSGPDGIVP